MKTFRTKLIFIDCKKNGLVGGFTLLETLVALTILTFAVLGPLTLAAFSIRSASLSQNQLTAFYLAQEGLEYIKNRRDNNALANPTGDWLGGVTNYCETTAGCTVDVSNDTISPCPSGICPNLRFDSINGVYSYAPGGTNTLFIRKIQLTHIEDVEEKVDVTVSWQERFGSQSFTLEENIFDWP